MNVVNIREGGGRRWEEAAGNKMIQNERLCTKSIKQRRCIWQFAIVWRIAMERMSICWRSCSVKTVYQECARWWCEGSRGPLKPHSAATSWILTTCRSKWWRSHLQWVGRCTVQLLTSHGSLLGGAQRVCNEDGSHFTNVNIVNSETRIASHNLSSSSLESHCQGPWTQKKHLAHRRL